MKLTYNRTDIIKAVVVYGIGDSIATLLLGEFSWLRIFGMAMIGATFYAFEIPNYFKWIESKTKHKTGLNKALNKTLLALLYFNPLWIFRHLVCIKFFTNQFDFSYKDLFVVAIYSFLVNIPLSLFGNFIIQNKIKLEHRFLASAIFSGLMAIYYAFSETFFS